MINLKNTILGTAVILAASLQLSAANYYGLDESGTGTFAGTIAGTAATKILTKFGAGELTVAPTSGAFTGHQVISGKVNSAAAPSTIQFTATQPADFKNYVPTGGTAGTGIFNYTGTDITGAAAAITVDGNNTSATLTSAANMKINLAALTGNFIATAPNKTITLSAALPTTTGTIFVGQSGDATGTILKLSATAAAGSGGTISLSKGSVLDTTLDTSTTTSGVTTNTIALVPVSGTAYGVTMVSGAVWKMPALNYGNVTLTLN